MHLATIALAFLVGFAAAALVCFCLWLWWLLRDMEDEA